MTDQELKTLLSQYQAPEPSPFLEVRIVARIAQKDSAQELPVLPSLWPTFAYAAALSVFLAMATGYFLGLRQCQGLLLSDSSSSAPLGG